MKSSQPTAASNTKERMAEKMSLHTGDENKVENIYLVKSSGNSFDKIITRNNASRHLFSGRRVNKIATTSLL
jgi:hypothetical protein